MKRYRVERVAVAAVVAGLALAAGVAAAAVETGPWSHGSQWISVRAGYAKTAYGTAPDGLMGYRFGYSRMITNRWSAGGYVHHEALGRFGSATEVEVPLTVEMVRHFKWNSALRPYLGLGGGVFYQKYYRTGDDFGATRSGGYAVGGANVPVDKHHLLGLDVRMALVNGERDRLNPVFGLIKPQEKQWSIKINWSLVY